MKSEPKHQGCEENLANIDVEGHPGLKSDFLLMVRSLAPASVVKLHLRIASNGDQAEGP
jgi:hypothetical protein